VSADFTSINLIMSSLSPKSPVVGYEHAIAGIGAGASATLATYPLDLLRTRFQGTLGEGGRGESRMCTS